MDATQVPASGELATDGATAAGPSGQKPAAAEPAPARKSSILGAAANYTNSIIGAGIIGLPFALREAGLATGVFLLFVVACLSYAAVVMIVGLGQRVGVRSYEKLAEVAFGRTGMLLTSAGNIIFAFGAMCAYLIILADACSSVLATWRGVQEVELWQRDLIVAIFAIGAVLPLSLQRDMSKLTRWSALSVMAVFFIMTVVIVRNFAGLAGAEAPQGDEADVTVVDRNLFPAIGAISFSFVCTHNSFLISDSLADFSMARWRKVALLSVGTGFLASATLAILGWRLFRGIVLGDLLENFANRDGLATAARLAYALTMVLTFPLELVVARSILFRVCLRPLVRAPATGRPAMDKAALVESGQAGTGYDKPLEEAAPEAAAAANAAGVTLELAPVAATAAPTPTGEDARGGSKPADGAPGVAVAEEEDAGEAAAAVAEGGPEDIPAGTRTVLSVCLWAVALAIALVVRDLGVVLELTGGLSGSLIGFVLPPALQLALGGYDTAGSLRCRRTGTRCKVWACVGMIGWGVLVGVVSVVQTTLNASGGEGE